MSRFWPVCDADKFVPRCRLSPQTRSRRTPTPAFLCVEPSLTKRHWQDQVVQSIVSPNSCQDSKETFSEEEQAKKWETAVFEGLMTKIHFSLLCFHEVSHLQRFYICQFYPLLGRGVIFIEISTLYRSLCHFELWLQFVPWYRSLGRHDSFFRKRHLIHLLWSIWCYLPHWIQEAGTCVDPIP